MDTDGWLRQLLHLATLDELLRPVLVQCLRLSSASAGAIWLKKDEAYYQRAGSGFAEAPLSQAEAHRLWRVVIVGWHREAPAAQILVCHFTPALMTNSSHSPGCMRASPASHCSQARLEA